MNYASQISLRVTGDLHLGEEGELVLLAQGLSPSLRRTPDGIILSVTESGVQKNYRCPSLHHRITYGALAPGGGRSLPAVALDLVVRRLLAAGVADC